MKAVWGNSMVYFSQWTWWGLGHEKMEAIFYPDKNVLEVMSDSARNLDKILSSLRRYRSSKSGKPIEVKFW